MTYSQYQQLKPSDLRRLCGVHHQTCVRMVAVLEEQVEQKKLKPQKQAQIECREELSKRVELRQNKYLNNIVEPHHRAIKRLVKPGMRFGSFNTARAFVKGVQNYEHGEERTIFWK